MAWRVTQEEVRGIVDHDVKISMDPFIAVANALTDKVSANDTGGILGSALLKQIELFLSAHYYSHLDQQYESKKTGDASATFQGEWGMGLDGTSYGRTAKDLDLTGFLVNLGKGAAATVINLGTTPCNGRTYEERCRDAT